MLRRMFLLGTTMLGGCALAPVIGALAAWAPDVQLIAGGISAILPIVSSLTGMTANAKTAVQNYLTSAENLAQQLAAVTSQATATPLLQQAEKAFDAALAIVQPYLTPGSTPANILTAIETLLPEIETVVNPLVSSRKPRAVAGQTMSPVEARLVLKSAAVRH